MKTYLYIEICSADIGFVGIGFLQDLNILYYDTRPTIQTGRQENKKTDRYER